MSQISYPFDEISGSPLYEGSLVQYNNSASFDEAYPLITAGQDDEYCQNNQGCRPGLYCLGDPNTSLQTCKLPPNLDARCTRSSFEPRCHKQLGSQTVFCPDRFCPPQLSEPPQLPPAEKCKAAEAYFYQPSNTRFCIYINPANGVPEQMPPGCCNPAMAYSYDVEPDYLKYGLAPQYYGKIK